MPDTINPNVGGGGWQAPATQQQSKAFGGTHFHFSGGNFLALGEGEWGRGCASAAATQNEHHDSAALSRLLLFSCLRLELMMHFLFIAAH